MSNIKIKILQDLPNHKAGQIVNVKSDNKGTPLDKFWRDRLKDAEQDNCVEIVKKVKEQSFQKPKKESLKETS